MFNPRLLTAALTLCTLLLLIAPVAGEEPAAQAGSENAPVAEIVAPVPGTDSPLSSMAARIEAIMEQEREQVSALGIRIASSGDAAEVMALQRQVQVVKLQAERDVLELQLDAARQKSAPEQVAQLEASIKALDALVTKVSERLAAEALANQPQR